MSRVLGLEFGGFGVVGSGVWVFGSRDVGSRVLGFGSEVLGLRVQGLGFWV